MLQIETACQRHPQCQIVSHPFPGRHSHVPSTPRLAIAAAPQMLQWEANDRRTCARPHLCLVLKRAKIQAGSCWRATYLYRAVPRHAASTVRSNRYLGHSGTWWAEAVSRSGRVWGQGVEVKASVLHPIFFLFALLPVAELARQFSHASVLSLRSSFMLRSDF